jgi:hypothetical protein
MFKWLKLLCNRPAREASQQARAFVEVSGECRTTDVSLRADEAERWVFAVFFQRPLPSRPTPYTLVAVHKDSREISELRPQEGDRYRPRGYK